MIIVYPEALVHEIYVMISSCQSLIAFGGSAATRASRTLHIVINAPLIIQLILLELYQAVDQRYITAGIASRRSSSNDTRPEPRRLTKLIY